MIIYIKRDLALNNLQILVCHKIQITDQPTCKWYCVLLSNTDNSIK